MALSKNPLECLKEIRNPLICNKKRWNSAKKELNFSFKKPCSCIRCYIDIVGIKNIDTSIITEPPNIWCPHINFWRSQNIPCCCRVGCESETDLIKKLGACECKRCCVCSVTNTRCPNCTDENRFPTPCAHIGYDHSPCLFRSKLNIVFISNDYDPCDSDDSMDSYELEEDDPISQ